MEVKRICARSEQDKLVRAFLIRLERTLGVHADYKSALLSLAVVSAFKYFPSVTPRTGIFFWQSLLPRTSPTSIHFLPALLCQAPGDELVYERDFARAEHFGCPIGVGANDWLGGVPIHEREVVIVGILGVGEEVFEDGQALFDAQPLAGAGEVEADDGGLVVRCHRAKPG